MSFPTLAARRCLARARLAVVWLAVAVALPGASLAQAPAEPETGRVPVPRPNAVELKASDGVRVAAFWLDCHYDGAPAAILLHNNGRDHFGWSSLWTRLQRANCSVLAIDFRGHGASRKLAPEKYDQLVNRDLAVYREMVLDAEAGVDFLVREHGIKPEKIIVIGGELGCGVGFALMSRNPRLHAMIALSPARNDYGFDALQLVKNYGKRPLLLVTTKTRLEEGPQAIADALRGRAGVKLQVYPGLDLRGQDLLNQPAQVERLIVDWLHDLFQPKH